MEEKEPEVGFDIKQFLVMWGQTAGLFGIAILILLGMACIVLGAYMLMTVAGVFVGSILFLVFATLGITIWGWKSGERP